MPISGVKKTQSIKWTVSNVIQMMPNRVEKWKWSEMIEKYEKTKVIGEKSGIAEKLRKYFVLKFRQKWRF